ncbi:hypothetical protein EJ05DRAFT_223285 [Pseudovirgaria hyperparasitica]|uniref:Bromo domain-containing protein n=1 Tax=Pseudovirgaria hyperparasitica TaxID=470096 RepID=A0A6A6VTJ7_9PEZI|nr:uncharacterized protein EJ05DRAFT_223285 [Pseudovirgaria hyperparasitica]KAF2753209.1 hypothetical protein EJ05DRAFT_223285 [Pseudovirgaria hyperparasitica]
MALDTIQEKLSNKQYPTLAALESDFKRLVTNAKMFNEKTSAIYLDAERVRKTASNWMTRYNPAYKVAGYSAVATPIPGEEISTPILKISTPRPMNSTPVAPSTQKLRLTNAARPPPETPATTRPKRGAVREKESESTSPDDAGKSLQDAQIAVIDYMINYTEEDLNIFEPFVTKPPRTLGDYYSIIKYPVALNGIKKKCEGKFHRGKATDVTEFPTWEAFEEEVSYIWKNAKTYNEDGSDIFNLALEFETIFKERLAEAKRDVPGPSHPTIKLKMPAQKPAARLSLKFPGKGSPSVGSPAPATPDGRSSATPGVIIDSGALARQQQHIKASINGSQQPSQSQPAPGSAPPVNGTKGNGVKGEVQHASSPRAVANGVSHIAMPPPPPHVAPRPPTVSPLSFQHNVPLQQQYHAAPSTARDDTRRKKDLEIILPNIQLSTNPALRSTPQWKLNIQSHPHLTHQSVTCTLPASQHILQVIPTIPVANTARPYRLFVTINGTKLTQAIRPGPGEHEREKDHPPYDVKLGPGVNRIEVELLAGSDTKGGKKEEVLREVCTIFVNLLRP